MSIISQVEINLRRYVAPVMEKTIKLVSDSALVATQIVQDIENYSTNVIIKIVQ
jgi:hypothetical protein